MKKRMTVGQRREVVKWIIAVAFGGLVLAVVLLATA